MNWTLITSLSIVFLLGPRSPMAQSADDFLSRWTDERNGRLVQGAFWTLSHYSIDEKHTREVVRPVQAYLEALANGDRSVLDPGAITAFKARLAGLLRDEDQSIRALAAVLLGICGDRSYANQLAILLQPRRSTGDPVVFDRGRAAIALGLVGAKEYTLQLVDLLKSSNGFDRAGAAFGLGALRAREHEKAVARLLNDADGNVRDAAKESLAMMRELPR